MVDALIDKTNEYALMHVADEAKIEAEKQKFMGRVDFEQELFQRVDEHQCPQLVYAHAGFGKTAFLCDCYSMFDAPDEDSFVPFIHFTRCGDTPELMVKKWLADPRIDGGKYYALDEKVDFEELIGELKTAVAAMNKQPILFIDDLHLMADVYKIIGSSLWHQGVMVVATCERELMNLFDGWSVADVVQLPGVTDDEAREIMENLLDNADASLPDSVIDQLLAVERNDYKSCCSPLWDALVVRRLTHLSDDDNQQALVDEISQRAFYPEQAFGMIIESGVRELHSGFFWTMLKIMAASEHGVRQQDLQHMAGNAWNQQVFDECIEWLGELLTIDETTGVIDFSYWSFRDAMRRVERDDNDKMGEYYSTFFYHLAETLQKDAADEYACREMASLAMKMPDEKILKGALNSVWAPIWSYLVRASVDMSVVNPKMFSQWLGEAHKVNQRNTMTLLLDVAMTLAYGGNRKLAAAYVGLFDKDFANDITEARRFVYNQDSWLSEKSEHTIELLKWAGFMGYASDDYLSSIILEMARDNASTLIDHDEENQRYLAIAQMVGIAMQRSSGEDVQLQGEDLTRYNVNELVDYAEVMLYSRRAPELAQEALDAFAMRKESEKPTLDSEIRANTMRCIMALQQGDVDTVIGYYDELQPLLKQMPDEKTALSANAYLLLWNIVRRKLTTDKLHLRAEEARQTFYSVLRIYRHHEVECSQLLQLCFYNLCSVADHVMENILYRGEFDIAKKLVDDLQKAIIDMKRCDCNSAISITGFSLAYGVLSNYYEQGGDVETAFSYRKQHEFMAYFCYLRYGGCHREVVRRYAVALDESGRMAYRFFQRPDHAQVGIKAARMVFEDLFNGEPTNESAKDLLACTYNYMQTLRASKLYEDEIKAAEQAFDLLAAHPDVEPDRRMLCIMKDDIADVCDLQGDTERALALFEEIAYDFQDMLDRDPRNENLMRSLVINRVRWARVLTMKCGKAAMARDMLLDCEDILKRAQRLAPDSVKLRDILFHYYDARLHVAKALGDEEEAAAMQSRLQAL